ncbi:hypothetical protein ARMGADRAFT_1092472 [Armillaria gallica]|uniref:Uncharacterized protein n=1 Tax=Armillaria gallica TaxID=47427 RepID=A0A2H3CVP5_ARMGA|nr:hypothetical protein ARMGADRAFT_1092472 [Armillaria gallica]
MKPLRVALFGSGWPSFYFIPPTSLPAVVTVTMRSLSPGCSCRLLLAQVSLCFPVSFDLPFTKRWFVHPGLLHTADNFARIKKYVFEEPTEPWVSAFAGSRSAQVTCTTAGSVNALILAITDDEAHATKGIERASFLTVVNGTDSQLAAGLQGKLLVNAAEIL